MKLTDRKWEEFKIDEIFKIESGKRLESKNYVEGDRPFIGAIDSNNGVSAFVSNTNSSLDKNVLGVNYNGSMCEAFYHPYECIFSDDVKRFHLKHHKDDENVFLFFKAIILKQKAKYNYTYKFNANRMNRQIIKVPVNSRGEPDYEFMAKYIIELKAVVLKNNVEYCKQQTELLKYKDIPSFDEKKWKAFFIGGDQGIFELRSTNSGIDKNKLIDSDDCTVPYITRTDINNGVNIFVGKEQNNKYKIDPKNVITIGLDTQTVFYQPHSFYTGQNIQVLSNDYLNKYSSLFIVKLLKIQLQKFNWGGNGATLGRLMRTKIMLPVDDSGSPDYDYMEQHTRNMMVKKYKHYLDYIG